MEKLDNLVQFKTEDGETIEMVVLKEFELEKQRYAILMDMNECGDDCDCGDECDCGDDCDCGDECDCGDDCKCEDDKCDCNDDCKDGCDCGGGFYLFKIEKDKKGDDIFKTIEDEREINKVLKEAEKVLGEK